MWSFCMRIDTGGGGGGGGGGEDGCGVGVGGGGGDSAYSLIRRTFVKSAQNLTAEKSQGGRKN